MVAVLVKFIEVVRRGGLRRGIGGGNDDEARNVNGKWRGVVQYGTEVSAEI